VVEVGQSAIVLDGVLGPILRNGEKFLLSWHILTEVRESTTS